MKNKKIIIAGTALALTALLTCGVLGVASNNKLLAQIRIVTPDTVVSSGNITADISSFSDYNPYGDKLDKIAESENIILYISPDNNEIEVLDKRTQKLWSNIVTNEKLLSSGISDLFKNNMKSLFSVSYFDLTNKLSDEKMLFSGIDAVRTERKRIKNGVEVTYDFSSVNIKITIQITLNGDDLIVSIPKNGIYENTEVLNEILAYRENVVKQISEIEKYTKILVKNSEELMLQESSEELLESSINDLQKNLITVKEQIGSDGFDSNALTGISDSIYNLEVFVGYSKEYDSALEKIKTLAGKIISDSQTIGVQRVGGVVQINLFPYLGSGLLGTDGYVFYPDNNGAVSYFNISHPEMCGYYSQDVYDLHSPAVKISDYSQKDLYDSTVSDTYISPVKLPVFGSVQGNSAVFAMIAEDEADASITYYPTKNTYKIGNIYCSFHTRQKSSYVNQNGNTYFVYDNNLINRNRKVIYKFLSGDDADYSGMARYYRDYLEENGILKKTPHMSSEPPLSVEFFMGTNISVNALTSRYISMTEFKDVISTLESFKKDNVGKLFVNIEGYTENYGNKTFDSLKPSRNIGGIKDLIKLNDYCAENNCLLSLESNIAFASKKELGVLKSNYSTVKSMNLQSLTDTQGNYMLNANYIYNYFTKQCIPQLEKYNAHGFNFGNICSNLVFDYNDKASLDRTQTVKIINLLFTQTREELGSCVGENVPQYLLNCTDWIKNVKIEDSRLFFTDENIPFYQMIIHGYIPYSAYELNQTSNMDIWKLKNIEYGSVPFYRLTAKSPDLLKKYNTGNMYSTCISDWYDEITEYYNIYKNEFKNIWNRAIDCHQKVSDNLVYTEYANGYRVYINYGEKSETVDGYNIEPLSYRVINGKSQ